jgi:ketosteroid isomerase-like protein
MRNRLTSDWVRGTLRLAFIWLLGVALLLSCVSPAMAQKEKKKKKEPAPAVPSDSSNTLIPMSDEQQIDYTISEILGAWQIGDVEKLHKDYAEDVSIVNGAFAPPIVGWPNYLAIYQQQRARMQQVRMDRSNTYIKVEGPIAWSCYQWEFSGTVGGQPTASQGHTTLVFRKTNNHWVVVHNHTSLVREATPASSAPTGAPTQPEPGNTPSH